MGANLVYSNTFESGWGSELDFWGGCYSYSFKLVSNPVRGGIQAARVENRGGDDNTNCDGWQYSTKYRAQLAVEDHEIKKDLLKQYGKGVWMGFSIYIPGDWPTDVWAPLLMQLNGNNAGGPEFNIIMDKNGTTMKIEHAYGDTNGRFIARNKIARVTPVKGQWNDFVVYRVRARQGDGNAGVTKVWMNGTLVAEEYGPNALAYSDDGTPGDGDVHFGVGIYWSSATSFDDRFICYYDSIRMASGTDSGGYDLVAPGSDAAAPPNPPSWN
jgi:hypothetical protein